MKQSNAMHNDNNDNDGLTARKVHATVVDTLARKKMGVSQSVIGKSKRSCDTHIASRVFAAFYV